MTTSQEQLRQLTGATAYDRDGDKLGRIGQVYFDDNTDQPKWITVNTGLFGMGESFVPLQGAEFGGDRVTLAYDKATIKDAPNVDGERHLDVEEEQQLYRHYGLDYGGGFSGERTGRHERRDENAAGVVGDDTRRDLSDRTEGYDTSGPTTDTAMTRSEEHLRAGTETRTSDGRGCASTWSPSTSRSPCRCRTRRSGSSGSRSPTPTAAKPTTARPSPTRSTRSPCAPSDRW